jgi:hypothetical protein
MYFDYEVKKMGIFSFISSCASSVVSAVCSVGKCVAQGVSSLAAGIGKAVIKGATTVLKTGAKYLAGIAVKGGFLGTIAGGAAKLFGMAAGVLSGPLGMILGPIVGELIIKAAVEAITYVAKKMGIIEEEEKPEEIGYRLEEAENHPDWDKRDDYYSTKEYYEYLKKQIPDTDLDWKKIHEHSLEYATLGTEILRTSISEELNISFPVEFLLEIGRCRIDGAELMNIIEKFIKEGYELDIVRDYLRGRLKGITKKQVETSLITAMSKAHPDWAESDIKNRIEGMTLAGKQDEAVAWMYKDKIDELKELPEDEVRITGSRIDYGNDR